MRLLRTALRRDWIRLEDCDALADRFREAKVPYQKRGTRGQQIRRGFARAGVVVDLGEGLLRSLTYVWAGRYTGQRTGRPRRRPWKSDSPCLIAADLQRQRPRDFPPCWMGSVPITWRGNSGTWTRQVRCVTVGGLGNHRLWFVCPVCRRRRARLYGNSRGCACRVCMRVAYR